MKALFIGGTGIISSAISRLAPSLGWEIYHLNRGNRKNEFPGVKQILCDISKIRDGSEKPSMLREKLEKLLDGQKFDVVADFISFVPEHLQTNFDIFNGLCRQFIFISSASAYQKPLSSYTVTESTPLANPFWEYSRNKIACEEFLMAKYRKEGFPVTIIRPSHTYDERSIPLGVHGQKGTWQVVKRMIEGKPVIIHGDGTSLWTLTHTNDFAAAFVRLMGNLHTIGEAVQITSDESITWNQIYQIIADAINVELNAVHIASSFLDKHSEGLYDFRGGLIGDKANTVVFDNTKLKRLAPEFTAKIRADEGLKMTITNVLKHPELQQEDIEFDNWCDRVIAKLQ
ncbi:MAG: SDR family oxidoreductase [Treponema sp.]|nr:SDR family oxidoreductase [Treponema sp.]